MTHINTSRLLLLSVAVDTHNAHILPLHHSHEARLHLQSSRKGAGVAEVEQAKGRLHATSSAPSHRVPHLEWRARRASPPKHTRDLGVSEEEEEESSKHVCIGV